MDDAGDRFLHLLHKISQRANNDHVQTAKFLLREKITRKQMEQCNDMRDLFDKLITKGLISADNIEILKYMAVNVFNDCDIDNLVKKYEKGERDESPKSFDREPSASIKSGKSSPHGRKSQNAVSHVECPPKFKKIFDHTAKYLGEDWKIFARLSGMLDHDIENVSVRAQGHYEQSLKVMYIWYKNQETPSTKEFKRLLRSIPRNDIADDLQEKFSR